MVPNDTLRMIKQRRSIRSFLGEQLKEEEILTIVEAGMYAPYAQNESRYITVIQNREILEKLNRSAKEVAKHVTGLQRLGNDDHFHSQFHAPTLIIVSGKEQSASPESDCAAATQNMLIAAESLGIGSCWIFFNTLAFFSPQGAELKEELKIPHGYQPLTSVALGYKRPEEIDPPIRELDCVTLIR